MYFEEVNLYKIDLNDKRYQILNHTDSDELENSINEIGLINPVQLLKGEKSYKVIAGWKRISALKKLKIKKAPANIFKDGELSQVALYKLIYLDNKHRADDLLKAELIGKINSEAVIEKEELINKILVFFDLNPSLSNLNRYLAVSVLDDEIKTSFLKGQISFEQMLMLGEVENSKERKYLLQNFFKKYKFNNNECRDFLKDLLIIKKRERISINEIWDMINSDIKDKQNKNDLRKEIKRICYPNLTETEKIYQEGLKGLKLTDNIKFVNHPYFEANDIEVRVKFKESKELSEALEQLETNIRKGMIDRLIGIIREGKQY